MPGAKMPTISPSPRQSAASARKPMFSAALLIR
jgi:hypothetical protein